MLSRCPNAAIVTILLSLASPDPAPAVPPNAADIVITTGDDALAMSMQNRRRRPRRWGGDYKAVEVTNSGRIEGHVRYRDDVPPPEQIAIVKDHETCSRRKTERPLIAVDAEGRVADTVVFLGDIKEGKPLPPAAEKPILNQHHCTFEPHVQVLIAGQPFDVVNSDPVAHNAQCVQQMVTLFNPLQPKQGLRNEFSIRRPGLAVFTCAVHNWMKAYAYVLWHPYYDVTAADGRFEMADVPPGEYELVVWQEHVGERTEKVTVEAGKTTTVEFTLEPE